MERIVSKDPKIGQYLASIPENIKNIRAWKERPQGQCVFSDRTGFFLIDPQTGKIIEKIKTSGAERQFSTVVVFLPPIRHDDIGEDLGRIVRAALLAKKGGSFIILEGIKNIDVFNFETGKGWRDQLLDCLGIGVRDFHLWTKKDDESIFWSGKVTREYTGDEIARNLCLNGFINERDRAEANETEEELVCGDCPEKLVRNFPGRSPIWICPFCEG